MFFQKIYWNDLVKSQASIPNLQDLRNKKILITGAGGLIGSAVVDLLICINETTNAGNRIYLGARNENKIKQRFGKNMNLDDIIFFEYDALKAIKSDVKFDYIIHSASPANPSVYVSEPVETMLANIIGINNLLEFAKNNGHSKILFVSSSEVYGKKNSEEPYFEEDYGFLDILNPRACYPSAKRAAETLCVSFYKEYEVESVIVRPGHIYGPTAMTSDTRASSQFFRDVINGLDIVMKSAGSQIRSYCYSVDCASAIIAVLLNGESCKAYNISNKNSIITIRQLAEVIARVSKRKIVFDNPSDIERSGYNLMDNSSLDSSKLEALGWFGQFSAEEGIKHTFEILKEQSHNI